MVENKFKEVSSIQLYNTHIGYMKLRECAEAMLELLIQHQPELAKKVIP
jgi:hypothetical protein